VRRVAAVVGAVFACLAATTSPAGAARECNGLQVCVPVAGPWVVVPTGTAVLRPSVEYQVTCPKHYVAGGLDAELSQPAIDVGFIGLLGSPVNPGISTSRAVVFSGRYVGLTPRGPTFRPHVGCIPAAGAGGRVPTASSASRPGRPTERRVRTVRVRPGSQSIAQACAKGEHLVAASHAFGFYTRRPPGESLVRSLTGTLAVRGNRAVVSVRADAELGGVRAVVQVHALCSGAA
jgi:hypothetical protein